ncbi:cytochrome P450 [Acephala macrosclerotiorum]|nr:cytochrome P450 [Acephala macrosclerotiorum]
MAILEIVGTASFLALLLTVFGAIRRLFFHPLAHIPGPRLAALTWWYEFYFDVVQRGRYVFKIQELHNQYGPIIRVTPDELYVSDVGFLDTVYAPSSSRREKYEYQLRTLRVPGGVGTSVGHDAHRKRREALSPFFSKRNVLHLEPLITQKIEELCQVIKKHSVAKTPVNLSDMFFAFSNEQSLPLSISKPLMPPGLIDMLALLDKVRAELIVIMKAKASGVACDKPLGPTGKDSVYDSVLDSPVLPPSEKSLLRLEQEGALLVLAGTESPGNLEQLPYLSGVIEEGNRLGFGVTARTARIAHETLTYTPSSHVLSSPGAGKSYTIPPGTPISVTTLSAHTAESVFPDPFKFDPERWLGDESRERRKFNIAFGKGRRKCLGIELALRGFDMTLWETDESDVAFVHDFHVTMPNFDSKGVRAMVKVI